MESLDGPRIPRSGGTDLLLWCGVLAGPIFVIAFLLEGATRARYDPIRMPVSLLALGEGGWQQTLNFALDGVLLLGLATGLWRASRRLGQPGVVGPTLVAVVGLGVLGAGAFPTDPGLGFPPGAIQHPGDSQSGQLHDLSSLLVFVGLPFATFAFARWFVGSGERSWALLAAAAALACAVGFVLLLAGFNGLAAIRGVAGLVQRLTIAVGWGFLSLLALHFLARLETANRFA